MTSIPLDATVEISVRDLLAIRTAAVTPYPVGVQDDDPRLNDAELAQFGIAPQREKHVVVNLADLRHAQKYGVLDAFIDRLDQQPDVVDRVSVNTDGLIRDASSDRPAVLTAPVAAVPVEQAPVAAPAPVAAAEPVTPVATTTIAPDLDEDDNVF